VSISLGPKARSIADLVRAQITDGTLSPGSLAPSVTRLTRLTGCNRRTARRALDVLLDDGTLTPGPRPTARPRIAHEAIPDPARILSALPTADRETFRTAYEQALTQARDPARWPHLTTTLHAWNIRAARYQEAAADMRSGDWKQVAKSIKTLRDEHGWTQRELSERSGLSVATIINAEHAAGGRDRCTLEALSLALGRHADYLRDILAESGSHNEG
jgi:DNA-binding transcriptional MocR family regulator